MNPMKVTFVSLTPSHLLKVTKFIVKISQFKFLVMTEKNIFLFHVKTAMPLEKSHPLFPSNPPLKTEILSSPHFFENLVGASPSPPPPSPLQQKGGGEGCTLCLLDMVKGAFKPRGFAKRFSKKRS